MLLVEGRAGRSRHMAGRTDKSMPERRIDEVPTGDNQQDAINPPACEKDDIGLIGDAEFAACLSRHTDREAAAALSRTRTDKLLETGGGGLQLVEADLCGLDLSRLDLRGANLTRAQLASADLSGANLSDTTIVCPLIERTTLRDANLRRFYGHAISMVSSTAARANLSDAIDCTGALFHGIDFSDADLSRANFAGASFYQCDLSRADLSGAVLAGAMFNECLTFDTKLCAAVLDEASFVRTQAINLDLRDARATGLSLHAMTQCRGVVASGAKLRELNIRSCTLDGADFQGADLHAASFDGCSLSNTSFPGCDLKTARFRHCWLPGAVFDNADLSDVSFLECRGPSVRFVGARAENGRMTRCSFPEARFGSESSVPFFGRAFIARDCDFTRADFSNAYLYRASMTGDPVTGMALNFTTFAGANLIQAYIAAAMRGARLRNVRAAYSRLNQSDLTDADLTGANLYEASLVKTRLAGASMCGIKPPLFIDRCPGLAEAQVEGELESWISQFETVIRVPRRGST